MTEEDRCLTVYHRSGCHLCDQMVHDLKLLEQQWGFTLRIVDVDSSQALRSRYGEAVPVLEAGGQELCRYHLDDVALRGYLRLA